MFRMEKIVVTEPDRLTRSDFPLVIANVAASPLVHRMALGLIVLLLVASVAISPFANMQLVRLDVFIPVIQSVMCFADLLTAMLLFAQYSIQPQRAMLALGSAYLCSGVFAFLQTLAFPGAYAPAGIMGGGPDTASWLFVLWHTTFPIAVFVYALWKDEDYRAGPRRRSLGLDVIIAIACSLAVVAGLTLLVTAGADYLPRLYVGGVTQQAPFANQVNVFMFLLHAAALVGLYVRRRTILDTWLIVTLIAWMPSFIVAAVATYARFSLGWYTARIYALIASCIVLGVLFAETTVLYSRLANAFVLLRRERANRLMTVEAATSAIAHELRQPLAGIAFRGAAGLNWLKRTPPDLEKVHESIRSIVDASHRANEVISSVRALFRPADTHKAMLHVSDIARKALSLIRHDLDVHKITVTAEYDENVPQIAADRVQSQQVILNLVRNAIDAMETVAPHARRLRLVVRLDGNSTAVLSVQDSGPGITAEGQQRIFEPFFTTKPSGMGLGLSICRAIMEHHQGELRLAKTDPFGSIFEIVLPIDSRKPIGPPE